MNKGNSHFKARQGCFNCRHCGRATRDTDGCNGNVGLCPQCSEIAMIENGLSDGGYETLQDIAKAEARIASLEKKRDKIIAAKVAA